MLVSDVEVDALPSRMTNKIPKPRKDEDNKGGGGRINQTENRNKSQDRGGRPHAGGAGKNEKPNKR